MAPKLSDSIHTLITYAGCVAEDKVMKKWARVNHKSFSHVTEELRLLKGICCCTEKFLLQDQTLESFFKKVGDAINKKIREIDPVYRKIGKGLDSLKLYLLFERFADAVEILKPLLKKAIDKYMLSSEFKDCTMEELLDLIQLVSEDGKEIHLDESLQVYKLDFLKCLIRFAASRGVGQDKLQDLLVYTKVLVINAAFRSYILWTPEVINKKRRSLIYSQYSEMLEVPPKDRISYIGVLKALGSSCSSDYTKMEDNILEAFIDSLQEIHRELLDSNSNFKVSFMRILIEELRFLRNFLIYKSQKGVDLDENMSHLILDVVSEAGLVSYSLSWDDPRDSKLGLSNWMEKVQLLKKDVAKMYPETSRYKFPRMDELGFMDGLLEDLKELISHNPDSIAFAQGQLDVVLEDLVFLRDFIRDMVKQANEHEELKVVWLRVIDVAYRFEFVINSLVVRDPSPDCSPTSLNSINEEIKKIRAEVAEIRMEKKSDLITPKISKLLPSSSNPTMDEVIVGFEDEALKIIDRLEANSKELDIVSIVGMPGQGKTTLAKKVYNDIRSKFHVCAWCCVSLGYQKRKLLLEILSYVFDMLPDCFDKKSDEDLEQDLDEKSDKDLKQDLDEKSEENLKKPLVERTDEDLEQALYRLLKGRRYLIVLDDVWEIEAWHVLQSSFPDDKNQSRILITSRIHSVGLEVKPDSQPHLLRQLNDDESWELLKKRLFPSEVCPAELRDVGMQIAKSCKGLPFAIVTVAGNLATSKRDSWEDIANSLNTALVGGTEECAELLGLSYINLPDHLKPCLLYFGSFLQDQEIPVSQLIWLWKAEGFVQKTTDEKRLEIVAEGYLKELVNRSWVMIVKLTSRGGTKACSVHDLVHQFCVTRAKEENFLQLRNHEGKTGPLSEPRRLCIYSWKGVRCFRHLRSLRFLSKSYSIGVSSIFCSFKILKVLDLMGIICRDFPAGVEVLVHLRFLALSGYFVSVPSTIVKLWNLETFLLTGLRGALGELEVISLPYTLLNMTKLRHVHVNKLTVFSKQKLESSCESCNLESFSTPDLSSGRDFVNIFKKMPHLRKLKCAFRRSRHENYQFPALDSLCQLESLNVSSTGILLRPIEFNFHENLKKLTLSHFGLPWTSISGFAQLPNLEVLKLLNGACVGETWDMEADEEEVVFTKLLFLKLENLDIFYWKARSNNFPRLRQLVLHKCRKLQGIPCDLEEVTTLEIIEVKLCHSSVVTSAKILEEEVEGLKAFI